MTATTKAAPVPVAERISVSLAQPEADRQAPALASAIVRTDQELGAVVLNAR